jgi:ABC-type glycerol-3-phosphate transport system substrate-binding protein
MHGMKPWVGIAALAAALGVAACGGGGAEVKSEVTTTTKGQQLMDLQKAYESGAITKEQYEREKQKVLSN